MMDTQRVSHEKFDSLAAEAREALNKKPSELEAKIRDASEQLVSSSFVLPILQQMQNDPFRSELFHGGQAEDIFSQQWNTKIADDMVKRANFPMVEAVYNKIMNHASNQTGANTQSKALDING
ncbi:hypothetical protein KS4_07240 [Poriferisphaera corsica]|uniref:Flagellar protein FlgJ N-terminal domain-containing protein n=2 Tax=Poriferisphaera corsica TaxID=2528020 RepID=A0A517YR38_9BACT|nr:hypothetical protein KS4_07240 [Poriferisphaera corsica]